MGNQIMYRECRWVVCRCGAGSSVVVNQLVCADPFAGCLQGAPLCLPLPPRHSALPLPPAPACRRSRADADGASWRRQTPAACSPPCCLIHEFSIPSTHCSPHSTPPPHTPTPQTHPPTRARPLNCGGANCSRGGRGSPACRAAQAADRADGRAALGLQGGGYPADALQAAAIHQGACRGAGRMEGARRRRRQTRRAKTAKVPRSRPPSPQKA